MKKRITFLISALLAFGYCPAQMISGGQDFTLSLCNIGTVKSWGGNGVGQLGNGMWMGGISPGPVIMLTGITGVAAGRWHSLAVKNDGTVWAFGYNTNGQLGMGDSLNRWTPAQVNGVSGITAAAGGYAFSMARKNDGTIWSWGVNTSGQLGNGTTVTSWIPLQVSGLTNATAIAAGWNHSLARKSDGTVWAWGNNGYGRLGDGTTTNRTSPVQTSSLTGIVAVAAGEAHSIALKSNGTVWAWGSNQWGQLGDGTLTNRTSPVLINTLTQVVAIASGRNHCLALKSDGTVWAWGWNASGELGNGNLVNQQLPVQCGTLAGVIMIAAGHNNSFAVKNDGTVWAWGNGPLGNGTSTNYNIPIQIPGICSVVLNSNNLSGKLFWDMNSNNVQDTGEPGMSNRMISETSTGAITFSEPTGVYNLFVYNTGNFTAVPASANNFSPVPVQHTANFTGYGFTDPSNDFAFQPQGIINDLQISITPVSVFRPGRDARYVLTYKNVGTTFLSGSVIFNPDTLHVTYQSASVTPSSVSNDSVVWNNIMLAPLQQGNIWITVHVNSSTTIGTVIGAVSGIEPVAGDANPLDNVHGFEVICQGSHDPNDKIVSDDKLTTAQVAAQTSLDYVIRFQNIGNDTAFNISILDTIKPFLDINTFEFVDASHPVVLQYESPLRLMRFQFDNILLPDSNVDEPGSNGFVHYRIKPVTSLAAGDTIKNKAAIYFDFNAPVMTNQVFTAVISPTGTEQVLFSDNSIVIFPNPTNSAVVLNFSKATRCNIQLTNALGELLEQTQINSASHTLDMSSRPKGIYFVTMSDKAGNKTVKKVVKM